MVRVTISTETGHAHQEPAISTNKGCEAPNYTHFAPQRKQSAKDFCLKQDVLDTPGTGAITGVG